MAEQRIEYALRRVLRHAHPARDIAIATDCAAADVTIHWRTVTKAIPALGDNERYELDITPQGVIVDAPAAAGALYGLQTLEALLTGVSEQAPAALAAHIEDAPRYAWRGLLLDVARTYIPVPIILRTLDAMAAVKLNVLHWHLTDDQGFRIESRRFPRLHQVGSDGKYYTQAEVRLVIDHAARLGIRVVPEFDVPGHTASWLVAYPELSSGAAPEKVPSHWGILSDSMDPTREETYVFLDKFLGEMAALFDDQYIHLGGDEVDKSSWEQDQDLRQRQRSLSIDSVHALHTYFMRRVSDLVASHGKRVVGWDEILQPGLPQSTVVQSWSGPDALHKAAALGHATILSFGFYLNLSTPLREMYANDPLASETERPAHNVTVLGGEACMWTELIGPENVERAIWPRAAAVAERLWSSPSQTDFQDFMRRLPALNERLVHLGIDAEGSQRAQLAQFVQPTAIAPLMAMLPFVESIQQNWWEGFTQRRPLSRLADFAPLAPTLEEQLTLAFQRFRALKGPARAQAKGELLSIMHAAQTAAHAVLRERAPAVDDRDAEIWRDAHLAATALLERAALLTDRIDGHLPERSVVDGKTSPVELAKHGLGTVFDRVLVN